jgi:hypothetical protein
LANFEIQREVKSGFLRAVRNIEVSNYTCPHCTNIGIKLIAFKFNLPAKEQHQRKASKEMVAISVPLVA